MAKSHAEFLNKFIRKDRRAAVKKRSDEIVIGQLLRLLREKQKLSQADLAERMGLKQPAIARLAPRRFAIKWTVIPTPILSQAHGTSLNSFRGLGF